MTILTLPRSSWTIVIACIMTQAFVLCAVVGRGDCDPLLSIAAFFIGGFVTDLISGLFHFSFDYLWPKNTPIMGPISVEFQRHHEESTLDPSTIVPNLTQGAYGALPIAIGTLGALALLPPGPAAYLTIAGLMATSLWMLGFHQIHAYAHMASRISPEEFDRAVRKINLLPTKKSRRQGFINLARRMGVPLPVRVLQRFRIFLRPETHWRHHISFDSDFSSVNGWSDPLMNLVYRPLARRLRRRPAMHPANAFVLPEAYEGRAYPERR